MQYMDRFCFCYHQWLARFALSSTIVITQTWKDGYRRIFIRLIHPHYHKYQDQICKYIAQSSQTVSVHAYRCWGMILLCNMYFMTWLNFIASLWWLIGLIIAGKLVNDIAVNGIKCTEICGSKYKARICCPCHQIGGCDQTTYSNRNNDGMSIHCCSGSSSCISKCISISENTIGITICEKNNEMRPAISWKCWLTSVETLNCLCSCFRLWCIGEFWDCCCSIFIWISNNHFIRREYHHRKQWGWRFARHFSNNITCKLQTQGILWFINWLRSINQKANINWIRK